MFQELSGEAIALPSPLQQKEFFMIQPTHIGSYPDYRDFLKEKFVAEKTKKYSFSLQYCADRLQVSKTFVKLVFDKKRHFSMDTLPRLWDLFKLSDKERLHLTFLFCHTISDSDLLKIQFELVMRNVQNETLTVRSATEVSY
ncbi:hypothetical protein B9G69_016105 [Bdellovibrio sp. SKB1291214]|uniref:hypothetical protein n=1 Tax=Bdellovibrio sp. SKB1291214 TaxID=1732569 RepID=UPI000B514F21|nr:hypothetical protein [Bdellovibrio sp. SKB1291214]UYL08568.1 hypothetical protein B9G69_016105 [Bdellovibrio sp. SKB1291214]